MAAGRLASKHQAASRTDLNAAHRPAAAAIRFHRTNPGSASGCCCGSGRTIKTLCAQHEHAFASNPWKSARSCSPRPSAARHEQRPSRGNRQGAQLLQTGRKIEAAVLFICRHRGSGNSLQAGVESNGMNLVSIGALLRYGRNFELDQGLLRSLNDLRQMDGSRDRR